MAQHKFQISALAAILALLVVPFAHAADQTAAGAQHAVAGEKLDSGLGELPHYSQWAQHPELAALAGTVPGEKLDSGLGALPHYSQWAKHPALAALAGTVPGEKLDSGLGELPHYSQWADNTGKLRLSVAVATRK